MQGSNNFWLPLPRGSGYSNKMIKDHLHCVHHEDV
jgi:hypothetical protein